MGDRYMDMTEQPPLASHEQSVQSMRTAEESAHRQRGEVLVSVLAFAALCAAVLVRPFGLLEPDDYAYRASILALTQGHWLSLTNLQYQGLLKQLSGSGGRMGIS